MAKEIERKFLIEKNEFLKMTEHVKGVDINQGYLSTGEKGRVEFLKKDGKYFVKVEAEDKVYKTGLSEEQFKELGDGLSIGEDDEVRLRRKGDKYLMTVKSGGTLEREEYETLISSAQFKKLWPATSGRTIKKTRYDVPYKGKTIELDEYHGKDKGFFTAEIELSEGESETFKKPNWLEKEVTEDKRYKNKNLAKHGFPKSD